MLTPGAILTNVAALGGGAVVAPIYPPATVYSFTDNPASGNTYLRDRPGWSEWMTDPREQLNQRVSGGNFLVGDGFGSRSFVGQDVGRMDGGQVTVTIATTNQSNGILVNYCDEGNTAGCVLSTSNGNIQVRSYVNASLTNLYNANLGTPLVVGDTVTLDYSWSGSTCTLRLYFNGVRYPNSSTSWTFAASGSLQPSGLVGVGGRLGNGTYSNYQAGIIGAVAKPRLTLNKLNRVYQYGAVSSTGTVPVSGVGLGLTAIQFRLLQNGSLVSGWDYGAKSIAGLAVDGSGNWSGTISGIPIGNNYQIQVRDSVDNQAGSLSRTFDVGVIALHMGQSQVFQMPYTTGRTTAAQNNIWFPRSGLSSVSVDQALNPFTYSTEWDWTGEVANGNTYLTTVSNGALAAAFRASGTSLSIGWSTGGYGSMHLTDFMSGSATIPYTAGPSRNIWQNMLAQLAYLGDIGVFVWWQGSEDAGRAYNVNSFGPTEAAAYKTNFVSYVAAMRAAVGRTAAQLPVVIVVGDRLYPPSGTIGNYSADAAYDLFYKTQCELTALVANCSIGSGVQDTVLTTSTTNEPHLSGTSDMGYVETACRQGYDIAKALGLSTTDRRGAIPLSMAHSGSTLAITFDANTATALTCAAAVASNFKFWTDNTFTTGMTPSSMSIGTLSGGQFVVTFTFAGSTATGNVVSSGKGGAFSRGGVYPDSANALKATQADGRSVVTNLIGGTLGYLSAT